MEPNIKNSIIIANQGNSLVLTDNPNNNVSTLVIPPDKHFIEHFLELKASSSKYTARSYETDIKQFFNVPDIRFITVEDIKKVNIYHCEKWILHMKEKGAASATINRKISSLSALYRWLLKYKDNSTDFELIKFNPFAALKEEKPKVQNKETEFLTELEVKRLLSSIKTDTLTGLRNKLIISVMLTTALRKSELINIKIKDINTFGDYNIISIVGKGNKKDGVKLQLEVKKLIDEYIEKSDRSYENNSEDYLFIGHSRTKNAEKLHPSTLNETITQICKRAGIKKKLTVHGIRHTSITLAIESGASAHKVRDFARHENIATTNRYIHNSNKYKNYAGDSIKIF